MFAECESIFAPAVIEGYQVIQRCIIKRDRRAAARESEGTVMKDSVCVGILVAWHCWPIVAFEGGEVNPACTRSREVVGLGQQAD